MMAYSYPFAVGREMGRVMRTSHCRISQPW